MKINIRPSAMTEQKYGALCDKINAVNFMMVPNSPMPVLISPDDRRYVVCEVGARFKGNIEYYKRLPDSIIRSWFSHHHVHTLHPHLVEKYRPLVEDVSAPVTEELSVTVSASVSVCVLVSASEPLLSVRTDDENQQLEDFVNDENEGSEGQSQPVMEVE
jgi:hypothetical protein